MGHSGPKVLFNESDQFKPQRTLWLSVKKKKKQDPVHYGKETRYYGTIRKADQRVFVPSEV